MSILVEKNISYPDGRTLAPIISRMVPMPLIHKQHQMFDAIWDCLNQLGLVKDLMLEVLDASEDGEPSYREKVEGLALKFKIPGYRPGNVSIEALQVQLRRSKGANRKWTRRDARPWLSLWGEAYPEHVQKVMPSAKSFSTTLSDADPNSKSVVSWVSECNNAEPGAKNADGDQKRRMIALLAALASCMQIQSEEIQEQGTEGGTLPEPFLSCLSDLENLDCRDSAWNALPEFVQALHNLAEKKAVQIGHEEVESEILQTITRLLEELNDAGRIRGASFLEVTIPLERWAPDQLVEEPSRELQEKLGELLDCLDEASKLLLEAAPAGRSATLERTRRIESLYDTTLNLLSDLGRYWESGSLDSGQLQEVDDGSTEFLPPKQAEPVAKSSGPGPQRPDLGLDPSDKAESATCDPKPDSLVDDVVAHSSAQGLGEGSVGPSGNDLHPVPTIPINSTSLPGERKDEPKPEIKAPVVPIQDPQVDLTKESVDGLVRVSRLLEGGKPGLAYQYVRLREDSGNGSGMPPSAVLGVLALEAFLSDPLGVLTNRLGDFYKEYPSPTEREWSSSTEVLAWAGTLRPALFSPTTGALAHMQTLLSSTVAHKVFSLMLDLQKRFPNGVPIGFLRGAGKAVDFDAQKSRLKKEVESWRRDVMSRTLSFQGATKVLQHWCHYGFIQDVASSIASEDSVKLTAWEKKLAEAGQVDRLIRDAEETVNVDRIVGRAEKRLKAIAEETVEKAVHPWLNLYTIGAPQDKRQIDVLQKFLSDIREIRPILKEDLKSLPVGEDPLGPAAIGYAIKIFEEFTSLPEDRLWAQGSDGEELKPLWNDLLLTALELDEHKEPRPCPEGLAILEQFIDQEEFSAQASIECHIGRGDLQRAAAILEHHIEGISEDSAQVLRKKIEESNKDIADSLRHKVEECRRKIGGAASNWLLGEDERGELEGKCFMIIEEVSANPPRFLNSEPMFKSLMDIEALVEQRRKERKSEAFLRLQGLGIAESTEGWKRVAGLIESGDHMTATEYIQLLQEGLPLPEREGRRDVFKDFYPEKCSEIHQIRKSGMYRNPQRVEGGVQNGEVIAGLNFNALPTPRRKEAVNTLKAWQKLKQYPSERGGPQAITPPLIELSKFLGFEDAAFTLPSKATGVQMDILMECKVISERRLCPVEMFGSRAHGKYRILLVWERPQQDQLNAIVGETVQAATPTIVFYFGRLSENDRDRHVRQALESGRNYLVLDENLLLYLTAELGHRLPVFFRCTLPFTGISPFVTSSSMVPAEMFYGRKDELRRLLDVMNGDCFVYGGRQLGKTALLREAQRQFDDPESSRHALWIDLRSREVGHAHPAEHIWTVLQRELAQKIPSLFAQTKRGLKTPMEICLDAIRQWLAETPEGRLLLLLDEADQFLEQDGRNGFLECLKLKNLMEETQRQFKVVFAGLHNVQRTTVLSNNPLVHLGKAIQIGPLHGEEYREAARLVQEPLEAIGFRFENPDLVARILARTNFYPSLIQIYCEKLLSKMGNPKTKPGNFKGLPPFVVKERIVEEVHDDPEHRQLIAQRFRITLQLDLRYGFLANLVAYFAHQGRTLSVRDLHKEAMDWWPKGFAGSSETDFRVLLDELVGLGVFRRDRDEGPYLLRNANTLLLLGTPTAIEAGIEDFGGLSPEPGFDPSTYRRKISPEAIQRSPITFSEEGLLINGVSGISIISGLPAADMEDLLPGLGAIDVRNIIVRVCPGTGTSVDFRKWLDKILDKEREGFVILLVPSDLPWSETWVDEARAKVHRLKKDRRLARIVFSADPQKLWTLMPLWNGLVEALGDLGFQHFQLRPWAPAFVRQWIKDEGHSDAETLAKRLSNDTGNWPLLLYREVNRLKGIQQDKYSDAEIGDLFNLNGSLPGHLVDVLFRAGRRAAGSTRIREDDLDVIGSLDESVRLDELRHSLQWAEMLGILIPEDGASWRFDPLVEETLQKVTSA